jgi:lycopene beta-cyclase
VGSLLRTGRPARISSGWDQRFRLYDSTLFQVMEQPTYPVKEIFTDLFRKNPADRVLRFLDERSNFREELQIANSVNRGAFARGMWRAISS